jgi:transcriptional regulator GlxA family with amidase domain
MTPEEIADLVHLRRARDLMDRDYAQPLDVPAMARAALMSPAHFSRKFRGAYGETPSRYRARATTATSRSFRRA